MAAPGRPTPQPREPGDDGSGQFRPRFRDRQPEEYPRADVNPYVRSHREWHPTLLPASEAWTWRGNWAGCFGREAPLHVEIGSGNGFFLAELAQRHPERNVLGVELRYKRCVLCAKKIRAAELDHARIARYHAAYLDDLFEDQALAGLYVNHPDPWPKVRHEKHRLISRWFLEDAARLLRPGGWLRITSDFAGNVDRVPGLLEGLPLVVAGRSDDITRGEAPWPDPIETNYQRKFKAKGLPVFALELVRRSST